MSASNWFRRLFGRDNRKSAAPKASRRHQSRRSQRPFLEALEDRLAPATNISIISGVAGAGTLDHFLSATNGTITTANDPGDTAATLSVGALQGVGSGVNISVAADATIHFNDIGTLNLQSAAGINDAFFTTTGTIDFANLLNNLVTAGGSVNFSAGANLNVANINSNGGDVALTAGTNGTGNLQFETVLTNGSGNLIFDATGGTITQSSGAAVGQTISATATRTVTVNSLRGTAVSLTSNTASVDSAGALPVQASGTLAVASATGITLNTVASSLEATNTTSGDIAITQPASPAQTLTITGGGVVNDAAGGTIDITNLGASIAIDSGVNLQTSGGGNIVLAAQDLQINGDINSGAGRTTLENSGAGRPIDLGTNTPGTIGLTQAELNNITAGLLQVGSFTSGTINVSAAITAPATWNTLALLGGATVTEAADGSLTVPNLRVSATQSVTLLGANDVGTLAGNTSASPAPLSFNDGTHSLTIGLLDGNTGFASSGSNITLIADNLDIAQPLNAGNGTVNLQPSTSTLPIDLGTTGVAGTTFGLTDTELAQVTASVLQVGSTTDTGAITVSGAITRHSFPELLLTTGDTAANAISQTAGLSVADLAIQSVGGVTLTNSGNSVDVLAADVTGAGAALAFTNAGALEVGTVNTVAGITTDDGSISLTVRSGGTLTVSGGNLSSADGNISLRADGMSLQGAVNAGTGVVTLDSDDPTRPIQIGGQYHFATVDDNASTLSIWDLGNDNTPTLIAAGNATPNMVSTIPPAPSPAEVNPYGLAFVPQGFPTTGTLQPGDILVANFNDAANTQGTGTTILRVTPAGATSTFFTSSLLGTGNALAVLKSGFVIVGNVPNAGNGVVGQGALQFLNGNGSVVLTLTDPTLLEDPWDLTVNDQGNTFQVFVSNVVSGTVTRLDMKVQNGLPVLADKVQIASGYRTRTDPAAFVFGPGGLAYDPSTDTLFVASQAEEVNGTEVGSVFAVAHAGTTSTDHGTGTVVFADPVHLHGPMGLAFAPNGDLIVANSDGVNADPNQPSELVEFTTAGQFVTQFSVDPANGGAFNIALDTAPTATLRLAQSDLNEVTAGVLRIGNAATDTGGLTIAGPVTAPAGWNTLDLATKGSISETAGSTVTVTNLAAQGKGGVNLNQANAVSNLAGLTTGTPFFFTAVGTFTVSTVDALSGIQTSGGVVNLTAETGTLTVGQPVSAGNVPIAFTADTMVFSAPVSAGTNAVVLAPITLTRTIDLGHETSGDLGFTNTELDLVSAAFLDIGTTTDTGTIQVPAAVGAGAHYTGLFLASHGSIVDLSGGALQAVQLDLQAGGAGIGSQSSPFQMAVTGFFAVTTDNSNIFLDATGTAIVTGTPNGGGLAAGTGTITLSGGTFDLVANNQIAATSKLIVGPATLNLGTFSETVQQLTLSGTSTLGDTINGFNPGQFGSLTVNGFINLGGATLNLSAGSGVTLPTAKSTFTPIHNNGHAFIIGQFGGDANNSVVTVGGRHLRLSYFGGTSRSDGILTALD